CDIVRVDQMPMLPFEFFRSYGSVLYLSERSGACLGLLDIRFRDELRVVCCEGCGRQHSAADDHEHSVFHELYLDRRPGWPFVHSMRAYIGCRHDAACGSLESILWTWPLETSLRHIAPSVGRGCEPPLHAHFDHVGLILIQQARSSAALLSPMGHLHAAQCPVARHLRRGDHGTPVGSPARAMTALHAGKRFTFP